MARPRIKGNLCAFTYKENGVTKVQLIHHNIVKPAIVREKKKALKSLFQ